MTSSAKTRIIYYFAALLCGFFLSNLCGAASVNAAAKWNLKLGYNGPPESGDNAVHLFASNFKRYLESRSDGKISLTLYPDSQLGDESQRMQLVAGQPAMNIASYAGAAPLCPELFAANIPFAFNSFEAAHLFFDKSPFWKKVSWRFQKKTGAVLLQAVEEGGFLAFTNAKRPLRSPKDFNGLRFRAMDQGQTALYRAFGATGIPIPWTELYPALAGGKADGQMNPPMYIIMARLYEVQKYLTMANIQYSNQFLTVNAEWFKSLPRELQAAVRKAAQDANLVNRIEVETQVSNRVKFLARKGMQAYRPTREEIAAFRKIAHPAYMKWLRKKVDKAWIDLALKSAETANRKAKR